MEWSGFNPPGQAARRELLWNFDTKKGTNTVPFYILLFVALLPSCDTSCDTLPEKWGIFDTFWLLVFTP